MFCKPVKVKTSKFVYELKLMMMLWLKNDKYVEIQNLKDNYISQIFAKKTEEEYLEQNTVYLLNFSCMKKGPRPTVHSPFTFGY